MPPNPGMHKGHSSTKSKDLSNNNLNNNEILKERQQSKDKNYFSTKNGNNHSFYDKASRMDTDENYPKEKLHNAGNKNSDNSFNNNSYLQQQQQLLRDHQKQSQSNKEK
jgi:hypothetical protein